MVLCAALAHYNLALDQIDHSTETEDSAAPRTGFEISSADRCRIEVVMRHPLFRSHRLSRVLGFAIIASLSVPLAAAR